MDAHLAVNEDWKAERGHDVAWCPDAESIVVQRYGYGYGYRNGDGDGTGTGNRFDVFRKSGIIRAQPIQPRTRHIGATGVPFFVSWSLRWGRKHQSCVGDRWDYAPAQRFASASRRGGK